MSWKLGIVWGIIQPLRRFPDLIGVDEEHIPAVENPSHRHVVPSNNLKNRTVQKVPDSVLNSNFNQNYLTEYFGILQKELAHFHGISLNLGI